MYELSISSLPREILLCVFQFLPPQQVCSQAAKVSKLFNELAVEPVLWKFFCESEFCVLGKLMNNLTRIRWQYEYFIMRKEWETLMLNNALRVAEMYKDITSINNDAEDGPVFENLRNVPSAERPPPITVQAIHPLRPLPIGDFTIGYYEIRLDDQGAEQILGLGLARNGYVEAMPGWKKGSIGFHADDGKLFNGCGFGSPLTIPWVVGDIVGCGIDFSRKKAIFTRNGILLGQYPLRQTEGLFATVGSRTIGEKITFNFGKKPFVFDVVQYQRELRQADGVLPMYPLLYSSIVKSKFVSVLPPDYDEEDDFDDEDNEFDDKHMNKVVQYFNSVLRVLQNVEEHPNEDGMLVNLVALLRPQLLPDDNSDVSQARQSLAFRVMFNKQSALLAFFMRSHDEGLYRNLGDITDTVLPKDDFPKAELVRCIAVLLSDEFRDDNPLVLNTVYRGRELFNFQPPPGMTIAQERGQLALALSREIQGHERERRTSRRDIMRRLREFSLMQQRQLLAQKQVTNPGDEDFPLMRDVAVGDDTPLDVATSDAANEADEVDLDESDTNIGEPVPAPLPGPINVGEINVDNNIAAANDNNNNSESDALDPEEFQKLLNSFLTLLADETVPDNDHRITAAIVQWYSTLDYEMMPDMEVSSERKRLHSMLTLLGQRVRESQPSNSNSGVLTRLWLWMTGARGPQLVVAAVVGAAIVGLKKWRWGR